MAESSTTSRTRTARRESARRCSWILLTRRAAWWLAPATSPSWQRPGWATSPTATTCHGCRQCDVPKTLVRHLVRYVADTCGNDEEAQVLYDVLDTPVSPELLPAEKDGTIAQRTEDLVGPYELHDFFLYEVLRRGTPPRKAYRLARYALGDTYDDATHPQVEKTFYRRYFAQQFKRSCLPDGPKVGSAAVSPRGDLRRRMPVPRSGCANWSCKARGPAAWALAWRWLLFDVIT